MAKLILFGLSIALALAAGCGKSFEAIQRNDSRGTGRGNGGGTSGGPVIDQNKVEADKLQSDANDLLKTLRIPFISAEATSAVASEEVLGVTLSKRGSLYDFQVVVKGEEGSFHHVRAELRQPYMDGTAQYSIEGMIEVSVVQAGQDATGVIFSNGDAKQYSVVYICTNSCARMNVYVQRVVNTTTAESGEVSTEGYAAVFTFDIVDDKGQLIYSSLSQNADIQSAEVALLNIQNVNTDDSTTSAEDENENE